MDDLLRVTAHRPWPPPERPYLQKEGWCSILFAHWPLPPDLLRPLIPPGLELDLWGGSAWLGITPFFMTDVRPHGLPAIPGFSTFPQVDLRTYVRRRDKPGVFYLNLEAPNPAAVWGARALYHMAYFLARVEGEVDGERVTFRSRRESDRGVVSWRSTHWPVSECRSVAPGTVEEFLIDRWVMYTAGGRHGLSRTEIHRLPWQIQDARVEILSNSLAAAHGISLPDTPPLVHCSPGVETLIWAPAPADEPETSRKAAEAPQSPTETGCRSESTP